MKESNKNGIIAFLVLVIIGLASSFGYYYYTNEHTEEKVVTNEENKTNVSDKAIILSVGETAKLEDYVNNISNVESAVFENNEVFSIDGEYTITANNIGSDNLIVTYKDGKTEKIGALCENEMVSAQIGEEVDLTKYINSEKNVKEIISDNESFTISENKVITTSEGEALITISYTDETEDIIKIKCQTKTSNAERKVAELKYPRYTITFLIRPSYLIPTNMHTKSVDYSPKTGEYLTSVSSNIIKTTKITIPRVSGYVFQGYYTQEGGKGYRVADKNGVLNTNKTYGATSDGHSKNVYQGNMYAYAWFVKDSSNTTTNKSNTQSSSKNTTTKSNATPTSTLKQQVNNCKNKVLSYGLKNDCVKILQQSLMKVQKCSGLGATGYYGNITKSCVLQFQKKNKLTQDGKVGPQTWNKLYSLIK